MMTDSHRGLRRLSILGTAILVLVAGVLVYLRRPGASVRAPEPKPSEYARVGPEEKTEKIVRPAAPPAATTPEIDPLEASRKAPPALKSDPRAAALGNVANPIAASPGGGPDRFVIRDRNVNTFFTDKGVTIAIVKQDSHKGSAGHSIKWGLVGAASVQPQPEGELPGRVNRFVGDPSTWQSDLPSYSRLVYPTVQPGVDVILESQSHALKYTVQMAAGTDPKALQFRYEGADDVQVGADGASLEVVTSVGVMVENELRVWQDGPGGKIGVAAHYEKTGKDAYAIKLDGYDPKLPVTVDPIYTWGTFLGGSANAGLSGDDYGMAICTDPTGSFNSYVAGYTYSVDFPTTAGAAQSLHGTTPDAFVAKFNGTGGLIWSTILGGNDSDSVLAIVADSAGNPIVGGYTYSSNWPINRVGNFQTGFIVKLDGNTSTILWSRLLGGTSYQQVAALAIDATNNVYATGYTGSADFPTTPGAISTVKNNYEDVFVTKIPSDGSAPIWSTFLGGTDSDYGTAIAVDSSNFVYVGGYTYAGFPYAGGTYHPGTYGSTDCFVFKLNPSGSGISWWTLIGGGSSDYLTGLVVDSANSVYITGYTYISAGSNYPITMGFGHGASYDAFVTKFNPAGTGLVWSRYLGGNSSDYAYGIAMYSPVDIYVAGSTYSTDFLMAGSPYQNVNNGGTDGFLTRLDGSGNLGYSTYLGRGNYEDLFAIAQYLGWVWVTGNTSSSNFPTAGTPWSTVMNGSSDAMICRFNPYNAGASSFMFSSFIGGGHSQGGTNSYPGTVAVDSAGNAYTAGVTATIDYPVTAGAYRTFLNGTSVDLVVTKVNPSGTAPLVYSTYIGGTSTEYPYALAVNSSGEAYIAGYTFSPDFPTTGGAFRVGMSGTQDSYICRLNASGSNLLSSTFIGGSLSSDYIYAIALDAAGNVYVGGDANSSDFFTTGGCYKFTMTGGRDCFVMKLNPTLTGAFYSTFLGGGVSASEHIAAIAVDNANCAYVTGYTNASDFPTTVGAFSQVFDAATNQSMFITKFNAGGSALVYSTFLGGSSQETPSAIAVDSTGGACVGGVTSSANFPMQNPYQPLLAGGQDGFVTKLKPDGSGLSFSTFLGGTDTDYVMSLAMDAAQNVYVTGYTYSTNFPMTPPLLNSTPSGNADAFAVRINQAGNTLSWATYIGGSSNDIARGIAVSPSGNVTVGGYTNSANFPVTAGSFANTMSGYNDLFVVQIANEAPTAPTSLSQYRSNGLTLIATGGATNETTVIMKGISGDPEGDRYKMQVEVRPIGVAFTSPATIVTFGVDFFESGLVLAGNTATVTVVNRVAGTQYHWQARSVDAAGVAGAWTHYGGNNDNPPFANAANDFRVDQTNPTLAIVNPTSGSTYNTNLSTVALSGTASDDVALFNITWFNAGNSTSGTASGTTSWSIPSISLAGGNNTITVTATDTAGNTFNKVLTVVQDASPPTPTITSPTNNPTYIVSSSPMTLAATATDNVGVTAVTWSNAATSGSGSLTFGGGLWSTTAPHIALNSGINNITVTAFDAAGNTGIDTIAVTYDPGAPIVAINVPTSAPTYYTNAASVSIGGTASDAITSVVSVQYSNPTNGVPLTLASGTNSWSSGVPVPLLAGATNAINVIATDSAGNTASVGLSVVQDPTPPAVNIVTPTTGATFTTNSSTVTLTGTASDSGGSGLTTVSWSNPATGGSGTATGAASWSIPTIGLNTGSNAITVTAADAAGNTASKVLTVTYDPTAPSVTINTPATTPTYTQGTTASLAGTASDNIGLTAVEWRNNGAAYAGVTPPLTNWTVGSVTLAAGANTIDVRATDTAGNTFVRTVVINKDNNPPAVSIAIPSTSPFYTTGASIALSGSSSDAFGVSLVDYQVNGGAFTPASGTTSWSIPTLALTADTSHTVTVRATDQAGNSATAVTTIIRDATNPTVAITTNGGANFATSATPLLLSGTAGDNFVVASVTWSNNGGASNAATGTTSWSASIPLSAGTNNIIVQAFDAAGRSASTSITVTLDQTNPTINFLTPTTGSTYSTPAAALSVANGNQMTGTAADNVSLASVQWRVNGGAFTATTGTTSWSIPSVALVGGTNTVDIRATDTANNTFIKTLTVVQDGTPPSVTITTPATNPAYTTSANAALAGTASDNNVVSLVEWRVVPGAFTPASGTTAWSVASAPLVAGPNSIEIRATDAAGNTTTTSTSITRDNTLPVVTITTNGGLDIVTNSTPIALAGTSSDNILVSTVQWSNNGGPFNSATGTTSWTASIPLASGSNSIVVRVTDAAGNQSTDTINVNYSTSAPVVTITSPTSSSTYVTGSNSVILGGTATSGPGIQKVEYRVLPAAFTQFAPPGPLSPWTTPSISLNPGANTIEVKATDTASNSATASITVTYDNVAPSLSITGPLFPAPLHTSSSSITISGNVSDGGGGTVASVGWSNAGNSTSGSANIVGGTWTSSTPITLITGTQDITVTATDSVGNVATKQLRVNLDISAPAVSITSPANNSLKNATPTLFSFTATDTGGSGVASVGWTRAEGAAFGSAAFVSGTTWNANVPLVLGTNTITPTVTDAAGNTATGTAVVVTLDQTNPSLAITSPTAAATYSTNQPSVALSGTVSDGGGGTVQSVTWTTTGAVAPTSGTATLGVGTWTGVTVNLATGSQIITITATDSALNTTSKTLTVTQDLANPAVTITNPLTGNVRSTSPVLVTFDATDTGGSGVSTVTWTRAQGSLSGSASFVSGTTWNASIPLVAGPNTITPQVTDSAGNVATGSAISVILDQTGPTLAITVPTSAATWYQQALTLSLSGTVSDSGGGTVTSVSVVNGANSSSSTTTVGGGLWSTNTAITIDPGSQVITVTATDSVGNITTATLTVIQDNSAPSVQITSPVSAPPVLTHTTGSPTLNMGGSASDTGASGLKTVTWSVNNTTTSVSASGTATGTTTWSAPVPLTAPGVNTVTITATDNALNTSSVSLDVTLNTSAPVVTINAPTATSTYYTPATSVTVSGIATAASMATITLVEYSLNGAAFVSASGTTAWTTPVLTLGANPNTIVIRATDNSLLQGTDTITIIQDATDPLIDISSNGGANFSVNSSPVNLTGTASDAGGSNLASVTWVNSATSGSGTASGTATWSGSIPLTPGPNLITFTATDGAGNATIDTITVTYDITAPTVSITGPTSTGSFQTANPTLTTLAGTAADNLGVAQVHYQLNGGGFILAGGVLPAWNVPSILLNSGLNIIVVRATDTSGNTGTSSITVTVDNTAPAVTITSPTSAGTFTTSASTIILGGTASDNLALASVTWINAANGATGTATGTTTWTATGIPLIGGANAITVKATDTLGNFSTDTLTVTSDSTPPVVNITTPATATFITNGASINIVGTASDNNALSTVTIFNAANGNTAVNTGTLAAWTFNGLGLAAGSNVITVTATDVAGNSATKTVTVTLDNTNPAVTITTPTSAATYLAASSPLTIGGTASDNVALASVTWTNSAGGSGTASGTATWSASVVLSAGLNTIQVTATDTAGNIQTASIGVTFDSTLPAIAITTPATATFSTNTSPIGLVGTASDAQGITSVKWANAATGGSGTASGTLAWSTSVPLAIGANIITMTATDGAGNTKTATVTVTLDTTAPTVAITSPTTSTTYVTNAGPVALSGTTSDNVSVASVTWSTTGLVAPASGTATLGSGTWSIPTLNLAAGSQVITVTATDTAGNSTTDTLTITLDSAVPTIAITSPTGTGTYLTSAANLAIGGSAADNTTVSSVNWTRVPALSGTAAGTTAWSATVPLVVGTNTFTFTSTDSAGNVSLPATIVVTRDTLAPAVQISGPVATATYFTKISPVPLSGTASDADGISFVAWSNAATGGSGTATFISPNWNADVPLAIGVNTITVTATDGAGNTATDVIDVTFDVTSPTVSISSPTAATSFVTGSGTLAMGGTMSDNVGVTTVTWATTGVVVPASGSATLPTGTTWSIPVIDLAIGSQIITVTATDAAGNSTSAVLTVILDNAAPGVTITGPTSASSYITNSGTLNLSGTATDNVSVASVAWSNSAGGSGGAAGTNSWSATIALTAGLNTITVTATDSAGGTSTDVIAVTYDATAPAVAITAPTGSANYATNSGPVLLGGTASDNLAVASVKWTNSATGGAGTATGLGPWSASVPVTTGLNVIVVTATDTAGNIATDTLNVTLDTLVPTVTISAPSALPLFVTSATTIALGGTATDNVGVASVSCVNAANSVSGVVTGTTSWSVAPIALVAGDNPVTVTVTDTSGNTSSATITIRQDSIAPVVSILAPTSSGTAFTNSSPLAIAGTTSDNYGVVSVAWSNPGALPASGVATGTGNWTASIPLVAGPNTITVTATDVAGNTSTAVLNATLDTTAPSITTTGPTASPTYDTATSSVTISGTASDAVGLASVTWVNGATGATGTALGTTSWSAAVALTPGVNVITITATDSAGNIKVSVITVTHDTLPPTINISTPTSAANFNSPTSPLLVGGTASDNAVLSSVTWTNSATGTSGTATGTSAWSALIPLVQGTNQITVTALDAVGNAASDTITVSYDPTAPTIAVSSPTSAPTYATTQSTLDFSGTATDNLGLASVTWTNNTTLTTGVATGTSAWTATVPLASGPNVIVFTATDGVGNTGTATITVTFDIIPPTVLIVSPPPPTLVTQARPLIISGTASDNVGVSNVTWSNGLTGGSGAATFTDPTWSASIPLIPGINLITIRASDALGNIGSATLSVDYSHETVIPTISIDNPLPPSFVSPSQLAAIGGSCGDNVGVTSVSWVNLTTSVYGLAILAAPGSTSTTWAANVPLASGNNVIQFTASDDVGNTVMAQITASFTAPVETNPPIITITAPTTSPTFDATSSPLHLECDALDDVGVVSVTWTNNGTYGNGITGWSTFWYSDVPLASGSNVITVTATDTSGNTTTDVITVYYTPPVGDPVPPNVVIMTPASSGSVDVGVPVVTLTGISSDNDSVALVTYANSANSLSATATGTTAWSVANVPLEVGVNVITARAIDPAGNVGQSTLVVVYTPPAAAKPVAPVIPAGMCGCTGLEPLLVLGAFWLTRRLRRPSR